MLFEAMREVDLEMPTPFLIGDQVYLRPLQKGDLGHQYLRWLNDPEVTRYLESGLFPYTNAELEAYLRPILNPADGVRNQIMLAIVEKEANTHIGNVKLGPIHWVYRKATFGIMVGEKEYWGRGIGTEATSLMVEYAFFRLNLRRIDLGVFGEHSAAIKVYESLGFVEEGRFREALFAGGRYQDHLWMGLLRSEYRSRGKPE